MTSELRAAGLSDPTLRPVYAAIYRAFRRRRSLLLFNLEKQVSIEELPWVAAIDRFRSESLPAKELSKQALDEVVALAITSFPHAILPNKLLQERRFRPAMIGLSLGLDGASIDAHAATGARRFLGWSKEPHWLLAGRAGD